MYWPVDDFQAPRFRAPVLLFKRPRQPYYYIRAIGKWVGVPAPKAGSKFAKSISSTLKFYGSLTSESSAKDSLADCNE